MKFNVLGLDYLRLSMAALHKDFLYIMVSELSSGHAKKQPRDVWLSRG